MTNQFERLTNPLLLPLMQSGVKTHYEGSIDKTGGNADWDWHLYQVPTGESGSGEWVLFDVQGPGCIFNFVQHRYPDSPEPTFRFYFDNEDTPRFTIRHSQFGDLYPFVEPLAAHYLGPYDRGHGPIRVVRSFVPMPFAHACKITSDICLEGLERHLGQGGWGHVIYQSYPADTPVQTFHFDPESIEAVYNDVIRFFKKAGKGESLIPAKHEQRTTLAPFTLAPGESKTLFSADCAGLITSLCLHTSSFSSSDLHSLWLSVTWDDHEKADILTPFGCFFANELGYNSVRYLYAGMNTNGEYYQYLPMPYHAALIELTNRGNMPITFTQAEVRFTDEYNDFYDQHPWGYLRSGDYYPKTHTEGSDSIIASVSGSGHVIAAVITGYGETPASYASCEGDVRIHFDGIRTPQIESDGSESYICYGWGFNTPPECNPLSGYDGYMHRNFSMTRFLPGEVYPFTNGFRFGIESGQYNNEYLSHSGTVFYYGVDAPSAQTLGTFETGTTSLESYFEGDDDHIAVTAKGSYGTSAVLDITIPEGIKYLTLRRMSDQQNGRQRAAVWVNGEKLPYDWYFADSNPFKRWLEDEFVIPVSFIRGQSQVQIRIDPLSDSWNHFGYTVFGCR